MPFTTTFANEGVVIEPAVLLLDEETDELRTIASDGEMPGLDAISLRIGDGVIGWVAKSGESYYVAGDHRLTVPALYHAVLREEKTV